MPEIFAGAFTFSLAIVICTVSFVHKIRHQPEPYAVGEREEKLEELETWRELAIENVVSLETLDDVTKLYHLKLREIKNHK